MTVVPFRKRLLDPAIAIALGAGYVVLLLSTVKNLGYARDEGFYFQAARSYQGWFDILLQNASEAMKPAVIDRYWQNNSEHPALMKSLFALSHQYLFVKHKLFPDAGTAFRFPGMVMSGIAVAVTYAWGRRAVSRSGGFVAAVLLAMMPRVFYHAHLACFDMPVAAMWLITVYVYWRSLDGGWKWILLAGVLYGLLLDTKHNSWLLPPALIAHFVIVRGKKLGRDLVTGRLGLPTALYAMALIGPVVFYCLWPWIWHDTGKRLAAYVAFHMHHEYYNMEFLGRTYWKPPMPLSYAWLMTLGTVPGITLLLFLLGLGGATVHALTTRYVKIGSWFLARRGKGPPAPPTAADRAAFATNVLWLLCILTSYAPWLSKNTPIFGGTKHWITAYPFLCLFAARGFELVRRKMTELSERWKLPARSTIVSSTLALTVLLGPTVITLDSHPWGLSAYTPIVGGAPGAANLGLNRTFWGYTTGAVQDYLNDHVPPNGAVFVHDTAVQSFDQMKADGRLRSDIRAGWTIEGSAFSLYHQEPHMQRVEQQIWMDYGTIQPVDIGAFHGVPVVWIYERPR
ncbi:MAG: glycosyltransferase family 39 protein [Myxococcales bacterium]|nr:glycosyltransferase family 39 protein [Myxococcales bacterium]MCB9579721.1 glycosyltransferase family 39 protein [Polyangiaceae bacterium]